MALRFVLAPYEDPGDPEWEAHVQKTIARLRGDLQHELGADADFKFIDTNHGLGADWATLTIEVLKYGSLVLFGVPALRKKLHEAWDGWNGVFGDFRKLRDAIQKKDDVKAWSMEAAIVTALERLQERGISLDEVVLVSETDVPGPTDQFDEEDDFLCVAERAYVLVFREGTEKVHVMTYRSDLRLVNEHVVSVAPAWIDDESAG